jgi:hypothetical protein
MYLVTVISLRYTQKKPGSRIHSDISATRLSQRDPVGFPPHPRGWFSIIVYQLVLLVVMPEKPNISPVIAGLSSLR